MSDKSVQEKINALRIEIRKHNYQYHVLDAPLISDYEYDQLLRDLKALEASYLSLLDPETALILADLTEKHGQNERESGEFNANLDRNLAIMATWDSADPDYVALRNRLIARNEAQRRPIRGLYGVDPQTWKIKQIKKIRRVKRLGQ